MSGSKQCLLTKALEDIIHRSNNGDLGTSKVIDMRRIAEDALKNKAPYKPKVKILGFRLNDLTRKYQSDNRNYRISHRADRLFELRNGLEYLGVFSSMEEAKAAAQSHHEKLILEALE